MIAEYPAAMRRNTQMYARGVYVVGCGHSVVTEGAARFRVQVSAAHGREHLDQTLAAFAAVGGGEPRTHETPTDAYTWLSVMAPWYTKPRAGQGLAKARCPG